MLNRLKHNIKNNSDYFLDSLEILVQIKEEEKSQREFCFTSKDDVPTFLTAHVEEAEGHFVFTSKTNIGNFVGMKLKNLYEEHRDDEEGWREHVLSHEQ